jgi:hypothetical protein
MRNPIIRTSDMRKKMGDMTDETSVFSPVKDSKKSRPPSGKTKESDEAMVRLSQRGGWSSQLDDRARDVLATRFSEPGEEAFDFALCARHRDGSIYGIADGKQCRVGRPVTRTDALKTLAKQGVPRKILGKIARIKDDKEFGKATRAISSGRKKQAATITPTKPSAASSIKPAAPKAGAPTQAKRKEAVTPDGRAEKRAKIDQLRAELKARRDKQKETEKPKEDEVVKAKKANMAAADTQPRTRYEKMLAEQGITAKNVTPAELERRIKAIELFEKVKGPEETQKLASNLTTLVTASVNRKATSLSVEEAKTLQESSVQKKLNDGFKDPASLIGGENAMIKFKDINDTTLDASWALLSPSMRDAFMKSGKPDGKAWKGDDENGEPINGGNGSNLRGRELFRLWLRQDGKCAYTGLPLTWDFSDLEHIKPMGQVGVKAENPKNWLWVRRSVNQLKGENDMDYLFSGGAASTKKGAWAGVNAIKDFDVFQRQYDEAQSKAAGKDAWRDRAAASSFMGEYLGNRRSVIEAFNKAGYIKYVAMALGNAPVEGQSKQLSFPQEQSRSGMRNAAKNLLDPNVTFNSGPVKGKMQVGLWIAENYPDFPPRVQSQIKEIYNDVRLELKSMTNPELQTSGAFGKEFAKRVDNYLVGENLET